MTFSDLIDMVQKEKGSEVKEEGKTTFQKLAFTCLHTVKVE